MDSGKPFKSIEVTDSRNGQVCKVACMSCIRGHRTTSCGIPICRKKIFWTVKRPGRPSNSCTCRYGATGGCRCVVARTSCTHKSRKGEKRSVDCRCDEQGRYCCILEPEHWEALDKLENPPVTFFPSRALLDDEQNEAKQAAIQAPPNPVAAVHLQNGGPHGIVTSPTGLLSPAETVAPYDAFQLTQRPLVPRFGMMGVGGPQGLPEHSTPNVLSWQGDPPPVPTMVRVQHASQYTSSGPSSCCQSRVSTTTPSMELGIPPSTPGLGQYKLPSDDLAHEDFMNPVSPASQLPQYSNFERIEEAYRQQQASAICQSCGLGGCSCRNCPPVFQNPNDGSWGQGCGRKHARGTPPPPPYVTRKVARLHPGHIAAAEAGRGMYAPGSSFLQQPYIHDGHPRLAIEGFSYTIGDDSIPAASEYVEFDYQDPTSQPPSDIGDSLEAQKLFDLDGYLRRGTDQPDPQLEERDRRGGCCYKADG